MDKREKFWLLLDQITQTHSIIIDRPKGSRHPRFRDYIYPLDYGYLEGVDSSDGDGADIWIGSLEQKRVTGIISSVDVLKGDVEIKILYACTKDEIDLIYRDHNRTDNMIGLLNIRDK